jgi:hypothetical protein
MNAQQTKALIDAARKAREALLALDPDSMIALELWTAINRATQTVSKERCCFCEIADGREMVAGFSKKLKLRMAHLRCAGDYTIRRDEFARRCETPRRVWIDKAGTREDREALQESLTYCACGGKAEDHRDDRDGNLLECSHCDSCDHFHYQMDSEVTGKRAA